MDPFKGSESEPENPIASCISMLSLRNFTACSDFARRLPLSDSIGRILTIADVLSAPDHYSVLRLRRSEAVNRDLARQHYAKFAILLDPTSTEKFPFQDEALARVREAWHVLSDPDRRAVYDRGVVDTAATFWTACPYCWNLYQYEKKYEGCSLMCQGCSKSFHGVAVKPPVKVGATVVEGEERRQYYKCRARVPLKFYEVKGVGNESENENSAEFVYVSDDDGDWEKEWGNVGGAGGGVGGGGGVRNDGFEKVIQDDHQMQGNEKPKTRMKTVARKSVVNRVARFDFDSNLNVGVDTKDCELEFTEGADDVFVGVRFNG
ncbi:transcription factor bHLH131 [Trifolium pratense]|uniref:Transcription factor bHLH131 n=2 Tax=Trifolium TaxID=3898 RepID=A0A2K3NXV6_TRIPR|nr:transcription factor bHLH131 [Trifolium pratense]